MASRIVPNEFNETSKSGGERSRTGHLIFVYCTHFRRKTALAAPGQQDTLTSDSVTTYNSGGYRARTGDLLAASQTLSQLS